MLVAVPFGLYFGNGAVEKVLLVGSVFGVFIVELLNSAIEAAVDHTSLEQDRFAARAKDIAAAAVFVSILLTVFVWALVLLS